MTEYILFRRFRDHYDVGFVGCIRKDETEDETTAENFEELVDYFISNGYRLCFGDAITTIPKRIISSGRHIDDSINETLLDTFEKIFIDKQTLKTKEKTASTSLPLSLFQEDARHSSMLS